MAKNRLAERSEIRVLDFKHEFRRSAICSVSRTIGVDRAIPEVLYVPRLDPAGGKTPSRAADQVGPGQAANFGSQKRRTGRMSQSAVLSCHVF
jgi:hypothetical protein